MIDQHVPAANFTAYTYMKAFALKQQNLTDLPSYQAMVLGRAFLLSKARCLLILAFSHIRCYGTIQVRFWTEIGKEVGLTFLDQ
jgi:hypothetical protein